MGTGSGHGGEGISGGAKIPPPEEWKYDPDYWKSYRYDSNQEKKNKEKICPIPDQYKAGFDELPDSSKYIYDIENSSKENLKHVWKNPKAKKELLKKLEKINKGELTPRNRKSLKGFKRLKEYKFGRKGILVIINPGKKGEPDTICFHHQS